MASGHTGRFELDVEHARIEAKAPLAQPGPAAAPIQTAGTLVVLTFQDSELGGVALWGVDPEVGTIAWKTVLGTPWPTPLEAVAGSPSIAMIAHDGQNVAITPEQIAKGGFVVRTLSRPGEFTLPRGQRLSVEAGGKPISVIVPFERSNQMWAEDPGKAGSWKKVGLPTVPAAEPIAWAGGIFVPGLDARAYLVDPLTGRSRAEPFVPRFDRDRQGTWFSPARLDEDSLVLADDGGRLVRVALKASPVPRLVVEAERVLDQPIIAAPASTGNAVIVATADRQIRALAARDLSPVGAWPTAAPLTGPPVGIGTSCFVTDRAGGVMKFGRDGQRNWSIHLESSVVGRPVVAEQSVSFVTSAGKLHVCAPGRRPGTV